MSHAYGIKRAITGRDQHPVNHEEAEQKKSILALVVSHQ